MRSEEEAEEVKKGVKKMPSTSSSTGSFSSAKENLGAKNNVDTVQSIPKIFVFPTTPMGSELNMTSVEGEEDDESEEEHEDESEELDEKGIENENYELDRRFRPENHDQTRKSGADNDPEISRSDVR